jgi:tripartite ATP-independent transporter DctM subunit
MDVQTLVALMMFGAMLALMALRVPIWVAMFLPGAVGYAWLSGTDAWLASLKGLSFARFSIYDLSVVPLFILMGQLASAGGLSRALFLAAAALVGHRRGGVAQASVIASAAFGAVCGSSVATAATIGQVALPEMKRFRYDPALACATVAAGGTLGILIPPSVVLVIYAIVAEQNIAKLFAAALVPGLLAAAGYCTVIWLVCRRDPAAGPAEPMQPIGERVRSLLGVWPVLAIFGGVFGGIYGGVFTAVEGAAVGALLTLVAGIARGELGWQGLRVALLSTASATAMIFMIFVGADMLNSALALTQMPARVADLVTHLDVSPLLVVAAILVFYIVLGGVMDELSMLLLTLPVLMPAVMSLDLLGLAPEAKAIWFGILVLCVVNIGLIAPPVGLNVYVVQGIARSAGIEVPMGAIYRRVLVFVCADLLRLLLLLLVPSISLWLVQYIG